MNKETQILNALVLRIRSAHHNAKSFQESGFYESAEMWNTIAGALEGVLYDADLGSLVSQIKEGSL